MSNESTPLLGGQGSFDNDYGVSFPVNKHRQFCALIGIPPSDVPNGPKGVKDPRAVMGGLYARAKGKRTTQKRTYALTAALSNSLLLSQIVLGATLTALGASESSHVLITLFGVLNTVIAGLVAYLKSRGQPMRARMFRDDLEHVVDEIENSEIMWLGITNGAHGYDEIDIDDQVSVRSEVARLTRLYERAVKNNTRNNPESYMVATGIDPITGLRARQGGDGTAALPSVEAGALPPAAAAPAPPAASGAAQPPPAAPDPDESPASAAPKPTPKPADADNKSDSTATKDGTGAATPPVATPPPTAKADDVDEEPATAPPKKSASAPDAK